MEKLGIFKIVEDVPTLCGYYDNKEDALEYLKEVKKMVDYNMQHQLVGEYILVPCLYFNIQRSPTPKT